MSYTWAFVSALTGPKSALARIRRSVPARLTPLDDVRKDPTLLRDAIYAEGSLLLRWLVDKSDYAEELVELRASMAALASKGARGTGALVSFIDGGPDAAGVAFELEEGAVSEHSLTTKKAVKAIVSWPPYRALVVRCEEALASAPKVGGEADADIRALVLGLLAPVTDTVLVRAARQAKLKIRRPAARRSRAEPSTPAGEEPTGPLPKSSTRLVVIEWVGH